MIWFLERWISNEYFRFIIYSRICDMRMARRSWDNFLVWLSRVLICDGFVEKFNSCQDMLDSEFLLDLLNQLGCPLISFAMGFSVDNIIAIMIKFFTIPEFLQPVHINQWAFTVMKTSRQTASGWKRQRGVKSTS